MLDRNHLRFILALARHGSLSAAAEKVALRPVHDGTAASVVERDHNIQVQNGISEEQFVTMRKARDATLGMPKLILPAIQVNMRGGKLQPAEDDERQYLKIPLNAF